MDGKLFEEARLFCVGRLFKGIRQAALATLARRARAVDPVVMERRTPLPAWVCSFAIALLAACSAAADASLGTHAKERSEQDHSQVIPEPRR